MGDKKYTMVKFTQSVVNHEYLRLVMTINMVLDRLKRAIQSEVEDYISEEILMDTYYRGWCVSQSHMTSLKRYLI